MPAAATVLITQTHPNHLALTAGAEQLGLNTIAKACVQITPLNISSIRAQGIAEADCWVFLSSHSVRHGLPPLQSCYQGQHIIAIGPSTAATLNEYQQPANTIAQPHTSTAIAQLEYFEKPRNIAIFSGKNSPKKLYHLLKKQHQVYQYAPYRRQTATAESFAISNDELNQINTITSHSAQSLQQLNTCIQAFNYQALYEKQLIVITTVMATAAKQMGFKHIHLAQGPTADAILSTLATIHT